MHSTRLCVAFLVLACLGMAACGDSDDQRAAKATVSGFYGALKAHDAKTACELVSPAVADQILRASGEAGKPCVRGLGDVFTRVARSANPRYFDSPPTVVAALVSGNHATVTIRRGLQRRRLSLTRSANGWRITGSPNVR